MNTFLQFLDENKQLKSALIDNELNESLGTERLNQITRLYGRVFGKQFGDAFKTLFIEDYTRSNGEKGHGYRLINNFGYQLRFNYNIKNINTMKQSVKDAFVVDSIDFWDKDNHEIDFPTLTVTMSDTLNVLQIWKRLSSLLKRKKIGVFNVIELIDPNLNENLDDNLNESIKPVKDIRNSTIIQRQKFIKSTGSNIKISSATDGTFEKQLKNSGLKQTWDKYFVNIAKGRKEKNSISDILDECSKNFEKLKTVNSESVNLDLRDSIEYFKQSVCKVFNIVTDDENAVINNVKDILGSNVIVKDNEKDFERLLQGNNIIILKSNKLSEESINLLKRYKDLSFKLILISTKALDVKACLYFNYTLCKQDNYYRILEIVSKKFSKFSIENIKQFLNSLMQYYTINNDNDYCSMELKQNRKVIDIKSAILGMYFYSANLERSEYLASLFSDSE